MTTPVPPTPKSVPSEQFYDELLKNAASYNKKLCQERKMRLPFLDSQTGVAQRHTNLFIPYRYRSPGKSHGQLYSYPCKRWKRKKSCLPFGNLNIAKHGDSDIPEPAVERGRVGSELWRRRDEETHFSRKALSNTDVYNSNVETTSKETQEREPEKTVAKPEYPYYYEEWENLSEPPDAGEIEHRDSDSSDFEETYVKKKKKKPKTKGGRGTGKGKSKEKKDASFSVPKPSYDETKTSYDEDHEKPYSCDICGIRYKTKPGLTYHMTHHHARGEPDDLVDSVPSPPPSHEMEPPEQQMEGGSKQGQGEGGASEPQGKYCDFCLGDAGENKKTGQREELVSCADCGRSGAEVSNSSNKSTQRVHTSATGHPSCLQFTANMIISVKKYPWQCIECKSCGLCGTSENDDQLLFCDDCDRGFHMYCLKPPLSQPPDGNWSCHLCIEEFYNGQKPEGMD